MDNSRIYLKGKEVTTPYYLNETKEELTKYVNDTIGSLNDLSTEDKSNLVNAINETLVKCNNIEKITEDTDMTTKDSGIYQVEIVNTSIQLSIGQISYGTSAVPYYNGDFIIWIKSSRFLISLGKSPALPCIGFFYVVYIDSNFKGCHKKYTVETIIDSDSDQTITSVKTFNKLPESSIVPTTDTQLTNKKYVDDVVEKDAIILEVYVPDRTNVTLNTQENRDKLNIWFNDILNKGYYRPLYIKSNATEGNLKEGFLSNRHLYRVLMASGFPLEGKPTEFKFYCLPTFNSISVSVLFGVQYRSTEQLETRAILSWNDDGSLSVTSVEWTGSKVYLPINTGTSGNSSKHLPLGVGNTTAYTPTGDYNPSTKKYVDDSIRSAIAGVTQFSLVPVDTLPTENIRTDAIYAIPSDNPQEQDVRVEYVYINDSWEKLGNTKIDLSNYYTKAEIDTKLEELHNLINTNTTVATSEEVTNILNGTTTNREVIE